jgi:outer membrane lipoprotein-sorting protein
MIIPEQGNTALRAHDKGVRRFMKMKKHIFYAMLLALLILLPSLRGGGSEKLPSVEWLYNKMSQVNPGLKDYVADIGIVSIINTGILPLTLNMEGQYLYKSPDKHKLKLKRAPQLVQKYPQIFGWNLPKFEKYHWKILDKETLYFSIKPNAKKKYDYVSPEKADYGWSAACYALEVVPREPEGDLHRYILWVDEKDYTIPRQRYEYFTRATVDLNVKFRTIDRFKLFDKMSAAFNFPEIRLSASAHAVYREYKLNQNLPDSVFTEEEEPQSPTPAPTPSPAPSSSPSPSPSASSCPSTPGTSKPGAPRSSSPSNPVPSPQSPTPNP